MGAKPVTSDASAQRRTTRPTALVTRQRLLDAGRQAFARNGLDGTNLVNDILEPSGVSVGSFYHQFRDKTDLFVVLIDEAMLLARTVIDEVQRPGANRSREDVARDSYEGLLDMVDHYEDLTRIQERERNHPDPLVSGPLREIRQLWITTLTANFRLLMPPGGSFNAELAAELVVALSDGIVLRYLDLKPKQRRAQRSRLIDGLVAFTMEGFGGLLGTNSPRRP